MKICCQLLTDEELEEKVRRVYPSAGSNKLRRIEFADFLRADSFPELIHITFAGFPFHNTCRFPVEREPYNESQFYSKSHKPCSELNLPEDALPCEDMEPEVVSPVERLLASQLDLLSSGLLVYG